MERTGYWQRFAQRRLQRRAFLGKALVAGAGITSGVFVACSSAGSTKNASKPQAAAASATAASSAGKPGGTLTHAINDDPPSLNLWTEFTYIVASSVAPMYNQLVQLDPLDESKVIGDLAKSWEYTNNDKTEIVFKLQDAPVTWHDGQPFVAEDVKATYDWLSNLPKGVVSPRTTAARNIDKVEVVDPKTIRFHLKSPSAAFLTSISSHHYAMGAKHIIEQTNTLLDKDQRPVGTGPFTFKDYKKGNVIDAERYKGYWRSGRPYLDGVTTYIIQEPTTALTNFLSGQLNLLTPIDVSDLDKVQKQLGNRGVIVVKPSLSRMALIPNGTKPPFNDPRMREAVSAAIDRDEVNQIIDQGKGFKGAYNNPKGVWALPDEEVAKFSGYNGKQDLQKAKQLMSAAGYGDGYKGRMPVRQDFQKNAVTMQAQLKKAGFDFDIQVEKSAVLTQRANATDFDLLCHTWATPLDDPDDSFAEMLISPDRAGRNWAKIVTPGLDKLFDQQRMEFDVAKRKQLSNEIDRTALGFYPNLVVIYDPQIVADYSSVKDYAPHVSLYTNQRFENVWLAR